MMEVKQSTGLDLNDLLLTKSPNTNNTEDDILGESITGNCKPNSVTGPNIANENSSFDTEDVIDLCDMDVDDHISPEIEDALLAGDDLVENKSELSNGHEKALDNMRVTHSPDDLDNLLSKLNDIVDDVNDSPNSLIKDDLFTNGVIDDIQIVEEKNEPVEIQKDLNESPVDEVNKEDSKYLEINEESLATAESDKCEVDQEEELKAEATNNQEAVETPLVTESIAIVEESETSDDNETNVEKDSVEKNLESNEKESEIKDSDLKFSENESIPSSFKQIDISSDSEVCKEEEEEKIIDDLPKISASEIPTCLNEDDLSIIPLNTDDDDDDIDAGACAENDNNENLEQNAKSSEVVKKLEEEIFPPVDDSVVLIDETFSEESQSNSKDLKESSNVPLSASNNNPDDSVVYIDDTETEEKSSSLDKSEEAEKGSEECSVSKEENIKSSIEVEGAQEEVSASKENKDKSSTVIELATNDEPSNTFIIDNSDNAQDDFSNEKVPVPVSNPKEVLEDNDSNNSSSSNLLQESKTVSDLNEVEEISEENDVDNDDEEAEDDVELIEDETPGTENEDEKETAPPAKRARLSDAEDSTDAPVALSPDEKSSEIANVEEEEVSAEKDKPIEIIEESDSKDHSETLSNKAEASSQVSLKRPHEAIESIDSTKDTNECFSENSTKKPKTDEKLDEKDIKIENENETKNIILLKQEDTPVVKEETIVIADKKPEIGFKYKYVPSEIPIPLYPPPKQTNSSAPALPLDFLKRFRKSFDKMTKDDLEALVMQKVVEAIVYKSEFAEMRNLIEKQEKVITAHRSKITELSKQFRDLEMVHNRVVKDIQTRNSQLIMPVKITRAVGLQVYLTTKKNEIPVNPPPSNSRTTATSTTTTLQTPPPPAPVQRLQTNSTSVPSSSNPQRPSMHGSTSIQKVTIGSGSPLTSTINTSQQRRIGCVQKVTPQRPMPQTLTMTSSGAPSTPQRILNKNSPPVVPTQLQRNRVSVQEILQQQQQQRNNPTNNNYRHQPQTSQPQQQHQTTIQRMASNNTTMRPYQPNQNSSPQTPQFRRSDPSMGGVQSSITTAKAKEKSFIDLTDEDDATESPPVIINNVTARRSVPAQPSRVFNTNQTANRTRTPQHRQNNISSSPMVGNTSVTKVNMSSNHNMLRYKSMQHPAPLPAAPAQSYNSSLKLPPPKPTIRISNLDNGIVISWSIDEPMDNHADCTNYQIYAYQETSAPPSVDSWHHVGTVKAMLLPMAVTLTQFQEGQRYFFAVRAVDAHQRYGPFSEPKTWG